LPAFSNYRSVFMSILRKISRRGLAGLLTAALCQGALANNVQVNLEGSLITILGDNAANSILISQSATGDFVVTGRTGTTVNGLPSVRFPRLQLNAAEVRMEGGNDFVTLRGVVTANDLFIDLGAGADRLTTAGPVAVGANLTIEGSEGSDTVQLTDVTVFEDMAINGGQGALRAVLAGINAGKSMNIIAEDGNDTVSVSESTVDQVLSIESKGGANRISVSSVLAFSMMITSEAGVDTIDVADLMTNEDIGVFTGPGNDRVALTNMDSGKSITVSVDAGQDQVIGTAVSAAEDAVFEGGAGTDTIFDLGIVGGVKKEIKEFELP
jgi:hypothetical protein